MVASLLGGCAVHQEPLSQATIRARAELNLAEVTADQEPAANAIGLYEAMARAIKYNLDLKVEEMTTALRVR